MPIYRLTIFNKKKFIKDKVKNKYKFHSSKIVKNLEISNLSMSKKVVKKERVIL